MFGVKDLRKLGRFDVDLKLKFEVKNWWTYNMQLPTNLGCPFGVFNCLVVFENFFLLILP